MRGLNLDAICGLLEAIGRFIRTLTGLLATILLLWVPSTFEVSEARHGTLTPLITASRTATTSRSSIWKAADYE